MILCYSENDSNKWVINTFSALSINELIIQINELLLILQMYHSSHLPVFCSPSM